MPTAAAAVAQLHARPRAPDQLTGSAATGRAGGCNLRQGLATAASPSTLHIAVAVARPAPPGPAGPGQLLPAAAAVAGQGAERLRVGSGPLLSLRVANSGGGPSPGVAAAAPGPQGGPGLPPAAARPAAFTRLPARSPHRG